MGCRLWFAEFGLADGRCKHVGRRMWVSLCWFQNLGLKIVSFRIWASDCGLRAAFRIQLKIQNLDFKVRVAECRFQNGFMNSEFQSLGFMMLVYEFGIQSLDGFGT